MNPKQKPKNTVNTGRGAQASADIWGKPMRPEKEIVFVLTCADRDRIDVAAKLLQQVLREIIGARKTRVSLATHTPGALYQLAEDVEKIREEQMEFKNI